MQYDILKYGNALLRRKAVPVEAVTDEVRALASDLLETMYAGDGIGLAAAQVGRPESMFVLDIPVMRDEVTGEPVNENPDVPMPLVLINPRIDVCEGVQNGPEGCLSFPGVFVSVKRAAEVTVTYMDLDGREQTRHVKGLLARAVQHERDHLDGVLLVDQMTPVQKLAVGGKLKRIQKEARAVRSA